MTASGLRFLLYFIDSMETIFDHNPTDAELIDIFGDSGRDHPSRSAEHNLWLLCSLFHLRGDTKNMNDRLSKLPGERQMDFNRFMEHLTV